MLFCVIWFLSIDWWMGQKFQLWPKSEPRFQRRVFPHTRQRKWQDTLPTDQRAKAFFKGSRLHVTL